MTNNRARPGPCWRAADTSDLAGGIAESPSPGAGSSSPGKGTVHVHEAQSAERARDQTRRKEGAQKDWLHICTVPTTNTELLPSCTRMYVSNVTVYTLRGRDADADGPRERHDAQGVQVQFRRVLETVQQGETNSEKLTGGRGDEGQDGGRIVETGDGERDWRRGEVGRGGASHRPEGAAMER